jgi:hypothetical protein
MSQKYLIVVQPALTASNYVNVAAFTSTIDSYMTRALGSVSEPSQKLVVFPGTYIIGLNSKISPIQDILILEFLRDR